MSEPTYILTVSHWEDADLILMARVLGAAATPVLQSTISSIHVYVYDRLDGLQVGSTLALVVADCVFDTLQTDARWADYAGTPVDRVGYNFRTTVPGTYFPDGDHTYEVEIIFTPAAGSNFPFVVVVDTIPLRSS